MTDKLENYQENNQTAYKGTASDDSITITDIDFSGSFVYTFEGNDTLVLELSLIHISEPTRPY